MQPPYTTQPQWSRREPGLMPVADLASMAKGHTSLCQVVRGQFHSHPVTCQNLDVILSHFARQMGQHFVTLTYPHLECSVSHTFNYSSIDRDHIFSWNDVTSFPRIAPAALRNACLESNGIDLKDCEPSKALGLCSSRPERTGWRRTQSADLACESDLLLRPAIGKSIQRRPLEPNSSKPFDGRQCRLLFRTYKRQRRAGSARSRSSSNAMNVVVGGR